MAAWLGLSAWVAGVFLMIAGLTVGTFFAEPASGSEWVEALAFSGAGVLAAAAGPFGVWLFHRRRGWLVAAGWAAVIAALVAAYVLMSFSAG